VGGDRQPDSSDAVLLYELELLKQLRFDLFGLNLFIAQQFLSGAFLAFKL
jgi:hypothetical protein